MKKTKEQKGITLIALIITIVVLMILAAVAINSITNDGILGQAENVANTYNQAAQNEQAYLQDYEDVLTALNGGYKTYSVGETVKVGTEEFYVIEDKTSQGKVVLLSKLNIDTENLVQSSTAAPVAFSTESYWGEGTSPYDIVEPETIPESHKAAKAAYDYGEKVGGTGRLMTYSEANTLKDTYSAMIYGTETTDGFLIYWLGSAYGTDFVWYVHGLDGCLYYYEYNFFDYDYGYVVRPVVEISKSKIQ